MCNAEQVKRGFTFTSYDGCTIRNGGTHLFQWCLVAEKSFSNNRVWILMHDILTIYEAKIEWIKAIKDSRDY